jgi:group II intron reverse transcriptase/maturase
MRDRIIQQAIRQVTEPILEAQFSNDSYGFRPNRSAENAVAALSKHINLYRQYHIVDLDIEGFFDNVVHHTLLRQLWRLGIRDGEIIEIIARMLKAEVAMPGGTVVRPERGTPQGGIISPILANVALNDLDQWVNSMWRNKPTERKHTQTSNKYTALRRTTKLKSWHIVRYADDVKIVCETKTAATRAYEATKDYLQKRLGLKVNPDKSGVVNVKKKPTEFLGISIKAEPKGGKCVVQSHILKKAKHRMSKELKAQAKKIQHSTGAKRRAEALKLGAMIRGYHNYYRIATQVSRGMTWIAYQVMRVIRNRCQPVTVHGGKVAKWLRERYGKDRWYNTIDGTIPIPPIHLVQCKPPMSYTEKCGKMEGSIELEMRKMMEGFENGSIEYLNSKISRYTAQKGKCAVTGQFLKAQEAHAHHQNPKGKGGSDEYKNIIILGEEAHRLVHATKPETVSRYLKNLNPSPKGIQTINRLRELAGNEKLMTA